MRGREIGHRKTQRPEQAQRRICEAGARGDEIDGGAALIIVRAVAERGARHGDAARGPAGHARGAAAGDAGDGDILGVGDIGA